MLAVDDMDVCIEERRDLGFQIFNCLTQVNCFLCIVGLLVGVKGKKGQVSATDWCFIQGLKNIPNAVNVVTMLFRKREQI